MGQPSIRTNSEAEAILRARTLAASKPGPSPHKLIAAGIFGVFLLTIFFMSGTFTAISFIDHASMDSEIVRAAMAVDAHLEAGISADAAFAERLSHEHALRGAHLTTAAGVGGNEVSVPVGDGGAVLAWTPRRFATEAFESVAPARLGMGMLVIAIVGFVMFRLHALARDLEARRLMAHEMACRDPLTGLRNRLTFDHELREAFASKSPRGPALGLLYLDLDGFKAVNDTYGHLAGDQLLRLVGERLTATIGDDDTVARLGGDEFAIIRREQLSTGALSALAICLEVALTEPFDLDGHVAQIGVSIGIARAPADAQSTADLVRAADAALYRAKAEGGRRFAFAEAPEELAVFEPAARAA